MPARSKVHDELSTYEKILKRILLTSLHAFSPNDEHAAIISSVQLNFMDVHGVVKFMNDLSGLGFRSLFNKHWFKSYKLTTPDLHLQLEPKILVFS